MDNHDLKIGQKSMFKCSTFWRLNEGDKTRPLYMKEGENTELWEKSVYTHCLSTGCRWKENLKLRKILFQLLSSQSNLNETVRIQMV